MNYIRRSHSSRAHRRYLSGGRNAFSLVEVVVAIALFGIAMSSLGALSMAVARQSVSGWGTAQRTAALVARMNDLTVVPFAQLDARAGCTVISGVPFRRTECITIANPSATRKVVRVTITPANTAIDPVFAEFERTMPPTSNPFNFKL